MEFIAGMENKYEEKVIHSIDSIDSVCVPDALAVKEGENGEGTVRNRDYKLAGDIDHGVNGVFGDGFIERALKGERAKNAKSEKLGLSEREYALDLFQKSSLKAQNAAMNKEYILKEWEKAKLKGVSIGDFIELFNRNDSIEFPKASRVLPLSESKLYSWQRAYRELGLNGLIDTRGVKEKGCLIERLGLRDLVVSLFEGRAGDFNMRSVHNMLHLHLDHMGIYPYSSFSSKVGEYVSYHALLRFFEKWKRENAFKAKLILRGEDALYGSYLPAYGSSNNSVDSINQVVEIDGTKLDCFLDASALKGLGLEVDQSRFVLISLIDTYSGVCSFYLTDTENSLGVARAVAKYISRYGKPLKIRGDNGSAFVSKYSSEVLRRLGIEYERTPAYSGWCKPYVERSFKSLQNALIEWVSGYIGHNVIQRQAIEFFFLGKRDALKEELKPITKSY